MRLAAATPGGRQAAVQAGQAAHSVLARLATGTLRAAAEAASPDLLREALQHAAGYASSEAIAEARHALQACSPRHTSQPAARPEVPQEGSASSTSVPKRAEEEGATHCSTPTLVAEQCPTTADWPTRAPGQGGSLAPRPTRALEGTCTPTSERAAGSAAAASTASAPARADGGAAHRPMDVPAQPTQSHPHASEAAKVQVDLAALGQGDREADLEPLHAAAARQVLPHGRRSARIQHRQAGRLGLLGPRWRDSRPVSARPRPGPEDSWGPVQRFFAERGLEVPHQEPTILVACEVSGRVRDAYTGRGMLAMSCDTEPSERPGVHFSGDVRELLHIKRWAVVLAFPPCTHLAYSGSQHFPRKRLDGSQWEGLCFVLEMLSANADAVVVEQPRSVFGAFHAPPDTACHPYHFGTGEQKETWLWYGGRAPPLRATTVSEGRHPRSARVWAPTAAERSRRRSVTPPGLAEALACQVRPETLLPTARAALGPDALAAMYSSYRAIGPGGAIRVHDGQHTPPHFEELLISEERASVYGEASVREALLLQVCSGEWLELIPSGPVSARQAERTASWVRRRLASHLTSQEAHCPNSMPSELRSRAREALLGGLSQHEPSAATAPDGQEAAALWTEELMQVLPAQHLVPLDLPGPGLSIVLPICVLGRPLVLLPAMPGAALGADTGDSPLSRAQREAAVRAAAEAALHMPFRGGEAFMLGVEGQCHVSTALALSPVAASQICLHPQQLHARQLFHARAPCWCSLEALAGDSRYELAAMAIARVLSFVCPSDPTSLRALRSGAGEDASFTRDAADAAPQGGEPFEARAARAIAHTDRLREALEEASGDEALTQHQRECMAAWADRVTPPPLEDIPLGLRSLCPDHSAVDLSGVPFAHRAEPPTTAPLPPPAPPPEVSAGLRALRSPKEIFIPELKGYERICRTMRRLQRWHARMKAGGKGKRPKPLALDTTVLTPVARAYVEAGGVIDCRDPEHIRFVDPRDAAFDTHLGVGALEHALEACPDRELLSMVRGGVTLKAGLRPQVVIMPNLNSLYTGGEQVGLDAVTDELHALVDRGWYSTHSSFIPFIPWRCAPRGAVARPGGGVPRGIVDNGGPRTELRTWPAGEPVVPTNISAGPMRPAPGTPPGRVKWHREVKPWFADACLNGAILAEGARRSDQPVYTFAFDFKYYFHQMFLRYGEWWKAGGVMPARMREGGASEELVAIVEKVLSMGTAPSSQIAQRLGNAILWALSARMDAADAPFLEIEPPEVLEWLERRRALPHDAYGTQARLWDCLQYTDDPCLQAVGTARAVRLLCQWHDLVGTDGFNLMYARTGKWHAGTHTRWLGVCFSPTLGVAWLPPDKASRILAQLDELSAGSLTVSELARLQGRLEHFRFVARVPAYAMYGMRDASTDASGSALPPHARAICAGRTIAAVARWRDAASNSPGTLLLAAAPAAAVGGPISQMLPTSGAQWHITSDAALTGTCDPGLGGYLHGEWWCVPLDHALVRLPIVVLELIAAVVNLQTFAPRLRAARRVIWEVDALAAQMALRRGGAHSADLQVVHEELLALPVFVHMRHRLVCRHTFGEGNPAADAASRGKHAFLRTLCERLGVREHRIEVPPEAHAFVARVCARLQAAQRPLPVVGGRYGMEAAAPALRASRERRSAPLPVGSEPEGKRPRTGAEYGLDLAPSCDMHDGPVGARPQSTLRKRHPVSLSLGRASIPVSGGRAPPVPEAAIALNSRVATSIAAPPPVQAHRDTRLPSLTRRGTFTTNTRRSSAPPPVAHGHEPEAAKASRQRVHVMHAARALGLSEAAVLGMSNAAEARAVQLAHAIRCDSSQWRLRLENGNELMAICRLLSAELEAAAPANTLSNESSNWKHWEAWCAHVGTTPLRNDIRANSGADQEGHEREVLLLAAGLPFILGRMRRRPGWSTPPTPLSALQVLRGIRRVHRRLGTPMAPLTMASTLTARLLARYVRTHGADALMPKRKEPLTNPIITSLLQLPHHTPVGPQPRGKGLRVDWCQLEWTSLRAMFATLAQTGMRKAEVALPAGDTFGKVHLSRANLAWRIGGRLHTSPTADALADLSEGDYALLTVAPSKADQYGLIWAPAPIILPFYASDTDHPICAARELMRLEVAHPKQGKERRDTPLFVTGKGKAWTHSAIDERFQHMLIAAGVAPEMASTLSMHSWRIYLACALLAKGASTAQILSMLRWRSDEALRLYARLNDTSYATWLDEAATADISSIRSSNIARVEEAQRAQEQRDWLARSVLAREDQFRPADIPANSHDDIVAEFQSEGAVIAAAAAAADPID